MYVCCRAMKKCELCSSIARVYCESDQASLCWDCDARVHTANFLVAKHSRILLCNSCQSLTPWTGTGSKLGPTVSVCQTCLHRNNNDGAHQDHNRDDHNNDTEDEEDEEEEEEEDDDDDDDDGSSDGDNQVVPLSSSTTDQPCPPSLTSSSSSSEESNSRFYRRRVIGVSNSSIGFCT